jgi:outer membrane protein OmpA-like peptidoglycan-associated protein
MADLLADLEIKPLTIHMNAGYLVAGEARDGVHERDNETHWGVGAELQAGMYVAILGEVVAEKVVDAEQPALDTVKLTPGLRFMTPKGVNFDVGVEFAMTDFNFVPDTKPKGANWNAVLGVSVNAVMLRSAAEIPKVEVAGRITDRETGEPLDALITVPGSGYRPVYSDPETGAFTLALDQGMVRVMVSKEGYKWQEKTLMLEPPEKVLVDFELSRKEPASGLLTGVVKDPETQTPLPAHVTLIDLTGYVTGSDPGTGIYLLKVPAGTHFLKVTSQDYEPSAVPVVVEPGKTAIQNFDLTPKKTVEETRRAVEEARRVGSGTRESGMGTQAGGGAQRAGGGAQQAGAGMQQAGEEYAGGPASGGAGEQAGQQSCLQGVNFAFDSWALEPSYNSVLMRDLEMLKANPKMIVEIRGHTDYIGPIPPNIDLSLERAISVRDWFVAHGVALERLPIRGYGKSKPIASNATEQGRWLNRRVEIVPIYQ